MMVSVVERILRARPALLTGRALQVTADLFVLVASFALAYQLRFDFDIPASYQDAMRLQMVYVIPLQYIALRAAGVHRFVWRYVGLAEIQSFIAAALIAVTPVILLRLFLSDTYAPFRVPLSVTIVDTVLAFGAALALRVLRRSIHEASERRIHDVRKSSRRRV